MCWFNFPHCFYSFDMCPNNCSGRGECKISNSSNTVQCECSENWKGEACDIPHCIHDCGYPDRGICNSSDVRGCSCFPDWQGRNFYFCFSSGLPHLASSLRSTLTLFLARIPCTAFTFLRLFRFLPIFAFHRCAVVVSFELWRGLIFFAVHSWKLESLVSALRTHSRAPSWEVGQELSIMGSLRNLQ